MCSTDQVCCRSAARSINPANPAPKTCADAFSRAIPTNGVLSHAPFAAAAAKLGCRGLVITRRSCGTTTRSMSSIGIAPSNTSSPRTMAPTWQLRLSRSTRPAPRRSRNANPYPPCKPPCDHFPPDRAAPPPRRANTGKPIPCPPRHAPAPASNSRRVDSPTLVPRTPSPCPHLRRPATPSKPSKSSRSRRILRRPFTRLFFLETVLTPQVGSLANPNSKQRHIGWCHSADPTGLAQIGWRDFA